MVCLVKVSGPAFCPDTPSTGARHLLVDLGQAHQKQEQIHSRELTVAAPFQACASQAGAVRPVRGDGGPPPARGSAQGPGASSWSMVACWAEVRGFWGWSWGTRQLSFSLIGAAAVEAPPEVTDGLR